MRAPGRPNAREKPVYRAPLTAILTATALLMVESFRSPQLVSCGTRRLRAWPRAFIWARHSPPPPPPPPPSKHPLGCWVCCVQFRCKCVVSCCYLCAPSSSLIRAWDRQWRSSLTPTIIPPGVTSVMNFTVRPPS